MPHYEERLERDLARIKQQIATLTQQVEGALGDALHALLSGNDRLSQTTALGDHHINRMAGTLDRMCHSFIALHLPSAGHLRLMSALIRANLGLERIGDYAVTICRESVQLSRRPEGLVAEALELMGSQSRRMLRQAAEAFVAGNAEEAKATMGMADQVGQTFETVFNDLVGEGDRYSIRDLFAYLVIFNMLERASDQAKNLCEDTVFAVSGEGKAVKVYEVLFLDEDQSHLGPMAEGIARKNFPGSGHYRSAGRSPVALRPSLVGFLQERGIDLGSYQPKGLDLSHQELAEVHVIVSLEGPLKSYLQALPFHTAGLEWELAPVPEGLAEEQSRQRYETLYRELAVHVGNLMTTLRGEGAP